MIYTCPSLFISLLTWKLLHCNTFSQFHEKLLTFNLLFCNCYSTIDVQGYDTMGIVLNDRAGFVDFDRQVNRRWKQRLKLDYKKNDPGDRLNFSARVRGLIFFRGFLGENHSVPCLKKEK